jgi:hypothetical protein
MMNYPVGGMRCDPYLEQWPSSQLTTYKSLMSQRSDFLNSIFLLLSDPKVSLLYLTSTYEPVTYQYFRVSVCMTV